MRGSINTNGRVAFPARLPITINCLLNDIQDLSQGQDSSPESALPIT